MTELEVSMVEDYTQLIKQLDDLHEQLALVELLREFSRLLYIYDIIEASLIITDND